jgi:hypothetical protein
MFPEDPAADHGAYMLTRAPVLGECEGWVSCYLSREVTPLRDFLHAYPASPHAVEAIERANSLFLTEFTTARSSRNFDSTAVLSVFAAYDSTVGALPPPLQALAYSVIGPISEGLGATSRSDELRRLLTTELSDCISGDRLEITWDNLAELTRSPVRLTLSRTFASITDISTLSGLGYLLDLRLSNNSITDISALSGLISLDALHLESNSITDLSALRELPSLWLLPIGDNPISDLSALSELPSLRSLNLNSTPVDISALTRLTGLTRLDLSDQLDHRQISALAGLTALTRLTLDNNSITDISALTGLTNLRYVDLSNNPNVSPEAVAALEAKGMMVIMNR